MPIDERRRDDRRCCFFDDHIVFVSQTRIDKIIHRNVISTREKHTHVVRFQPKPPVVRKTVDHRRLTDRRTGGKNILPGSLVKSFRVTFH
jgi:hypothetical protein